MVRDPRFTAALHGVARGEVLEGTGVIVEQSAAGAGSGAVPVRQGRLPDMRGVGIAKGGTRRPEFRSCFRRWLVFLLSVLFGAAGLPDGAAAQTAFTLPAPAYGPMLSGSWTATLGAEGSWSPRFEGAKTGVVGALPLISIQRAGSAEGFRSSRDSNISVALLDFGGLRAGPAASFVWARKESSNAALKGLGDVNMAFELGGYVEYFPYDWLRLRNDTRAGLGGHQGVTSDFAADFILPVTPALTFSAGPRFTYASAGAVSPYFSIDAAQAALSGLDRFNAGGGAHRVGAGGQIRYNIDPRWEVHSYLEYGRLLGDASQSPLVAVRGSPNQTSVGVGASYSFDFQIR
ncbi:MAG: MipA/OmpV family protein [Alphaproteobacteria bacterium]|nr:MipA/OmpV family protein [Alphaproteobacteria bacterium]